MKDKLNTITKPKVTLRGKAQNYRHCDSTWTFVLNTCDIKLEEKSLKSQHCKIVAFDTALTGDGKKPPNKKESGQKGGGNKKKRRE